MTNKYMYFVANWKMFGDLRTLNTLKKVITFVKKFKKKKFKLIYCPPSTLINPLSKIFKNISIDVGAQNSHSNENYGAYATAAGRYCEGEAVVTQVNKDGEDGQEYKISNIWPTNLGEIALGWENDAIEEYTVEWCYDAWASV